MALFESKEEATEKVAAKKTTVKKAKKAVIAPAQNSEIAYNVLVEPWVTEKSHAAMAHNKYTFKVTTSATKREIQKAVAGMYNVTVESVNMTTVHPKKKNYGRYEGEKSGFKKATVELKEGDKIEFFKAA